jgi:hypothetical protein
MVKALKRADAGGSAAHQQRAGEAGDDWNAALQLFFKDGDGLGHGVVDDMAHTEMKLALKGSFLGQ